MPSGCCHPSIDASWRWRQCSAWKRRRPTSPRSAGADPEEVHLALSAASCSGLLDRGPDGWTFTHDVVRRAALDALTPLEAMAAHARAVAVVPADNRPSSVARRAHHALLAAPRSEADAWRAVSKCRHAAGVLAAGFDYERAAGLLDSAVELVERLSPPAEHVEVLLEWADARLVCGRLVDARVAYERASAAAQAAADPLAQARAALGLGGVWVNEHRGQVDRTRVLELQRSALDGLPPADTGLRARLQVRLAAEAVYDGAPVGPVFETLAVARQLGDPRALAEALSLSHHALLAPEHLADRLAIADDLIRVATAAGDSLRVLFGLLWKAVDQFHGGDVAAVRTLNELRHRADAVGCRTVSYMVSAIDVMRTIREGRLDEAEAAAHDCFTFGIDLGDADATGYYGVHLLTIRWLQDRDAELLDLARDIASSDTMVAPDFAFRAGVAAVAARAGLVEEAIAGVRSLGRLDALPRSSTWLAGMVILMEAAWALGDAELANELSPLLEPFADRPAMPSLAVSCFGSVERALGLGALLAGHADAAVDHLDRAVQANAALGHWPLVALSRADLAAALERRGRAGDRAAARAAWERAGTEATSMGMDRRAATWLARAGELAAPDPDAAVLRRDGEQWVVDVDDRRVVVPDLVGFRYLGWLLAHPGDEISAVELCGGASIHGSRLRAARSRRPRRLPAAGAGDRSPPRVGRTTWRHDAQRQPPARARGAARRAVGGPRPLGRLAAFRGLRRAGAHGRAQGADASDRRDRRVARRARRRAARHDHHWPALRLSARPGALTPLVGRRRVATSAEGEASSRPPFDESSQALEVAGPDPPNDLSAADPLAEATTQPPREGELFLPLEAGAPAVEGLQSEAAGARDHPIVADAHRVLGIPLGDLHAVGQPDRADAR